MKKILSAALALVCVWFATPAFANCNLFNGHSAAVTLDETNNVLSNRITDTRTGFYLQVQMKKTDNSYFTPIAQVDIATGKKNFTFNVPEDIEWFVIKHNGLKQDIHIASDTLRPSAGKYTLSFDVLSNDPTTVGGLQLKNIKLERGDTATEYTPYNPLCATCDGTVVNYVSATGTGVQNGTPTPDNPIEPTFYKQGNMVLRKVGDYADTYDATTGKITRRVGVAVLDGTEDWVVSSLYLSSMYNLVIDGLYAVGQEGNVSSPYSSHFGHTTSWIGTGERTKKVMSYRAGNISVIGLGYDASANNLEGFKAWLAAQKAAGTPVTIYYPLKTETTEDWPASYCERPIKIATTKYNETAFSPLNTALQNAISVVDSVVKQTIEQAENIAKLQTQKQTRPNDIADDNEKCPAGKKCLLVEDASGIPHWYEIVENAWDLPVGYTQLEYIESTGTQWINTGVTPAQLSRNSTEIFIDGQYTERYADNFAALFGTQVSSVWFKSDIKNNTSIGVQMGEANTETVVNVGNALSRVKININTQNNLCYVNNSSYALHISNSAFGLSGQITLFKSNGVANDQYAKAKIYSMYIKNNGAHVRNFIPVKQNNDGAIGMYDTVEGRFYENAGDGEFVAGPVVQ